MKVVPKSILIPIPMFCAYHQRHLGPSSHESSSQVACKVAKVCLAILCLRLFALGIHEVLGIAIYLLRLVALGFLGVLSICLRLVDIGFLSRSCEVQSASSKRCRICDVLTFSLVFLICLRIARDRVRIERTGIGDCDPIVTIDDDRHINGSIFAHKLDSTGGT